VAGHDGLPFEFSDVIGVVEGNEKARICGISANRAVSGALLKMGRVCRTSVTLVNGFYEKISLSR
jgi:hypothetical protein